VPFLTLHHVWTQVVILSLMDRGGPSTLAGEKHETERAGLPHIARRYVIAWISFCLTPVGGEELSKFTRLVKAFGP